jgi:uncharacterized protein (DUF2252 family)
MPRPRRTELAPPTRAVALIALLCTLAAVRPPHATLAFGSVPQSPPSIARLEPTEASVRRLPAALRAQIRDNRYEYFRFVNVQWMHAMCDRFSDARTGLPNVRLHGDPHIEQYAFTADSRGLDDFDDSTLGPFVLDVTRFLASVDLALDQRGWNGSRDQATGAFLAGYRASLSDTTYSSRLEPRIRSAVADQTADLVEAWRRFRAR